MRFGELLGLTWPDIDFTKSLIHVNKQIPTRYIKDDPREAPVPRSEAGFRILPVSRNLLNDLQQQREAWRKRMVFPESTWKDRNLVFPPRVGTPLSAKRPQKACKEIFVSIGLDESFTFHNLWHTAASLMLDNGMSSVELSRYLGHTSPATAAQVYSHLIAGGLDEAIDVFDRVLLRKDPPREQACYCRRFRIC